MVSGIPATPASISLTWNMPDVTEAEAPLTGYEIMFVDDRFIGLARIVPDIISVEVGLQTSHLQTGLSPNTPYSVEIAAVNLIGTGPFSSSLNFRITSGEGSKPFLPQYTYKFICTYVSLNVCSFWSSFIFDNIKCWY